MVNLKSIWCGTGWMDNLAKEGYFDHDDIEGTTASARIHEAIL